MRHTLRVVIAAGAAVLAWGALAVPKDSVTLGVILEPPGLDPTTGAQNEQRFVTLCQCTILERVQRCAVGEHETPGEFEILVADIARQQDDVACVYDNFLRVSTE